MKKRTQNSRAKTLNALAVIAATEEAMNNSFNYSTGCYDNYEAHFGKGLKKLGKKLKKSIKKVGKAIAKIAKNTVGNLALAPLIPFVPAMKKGLKKAGVPIPQNLPDLASKFYQVVIQKKQNFEYDYSLEEQMKHADPVVTPMIIGAIVNFIKGLLKKKAEGMPLTPDEEIITTEVEDSSDQLTGEAAGQQKNTTNTTTTEGEGMDIKKMLPIALIALALLYIVSK
jgi:hypothetical protein